MRVTGKVGDDHWAAAFVKCPSVYLNGVEQTRDVLEADDIAGYVRCLVTHDGHALIEGDHFVIAKLYGIVEIFGQRHE